MIVLSHIYLDHHLPESSNEILKVHYPGKVKFLLNYLDKIEKNESLKCLYILYYDVDKLKQDFFSQFRIIRASGGLVINDEGKALFIFRRGHWDLPKGKMEANETKRESALREVVEETGLKKVSIIKKLLNTYHIYRGQNTNRRILKPSYWFLMYTEEKKVIPQVEEDIDLVEWKRLNPKLIAHLSPIYSNIKDVLHAYLKIVE